MADPNGRADPPNFSARLFAHGGIYGLEQVIQTVVAFVLLPVYARYLGTSGYGQIGLLLSFGGVLSIVIFQGFGAAWFRLRFLPEIRNRLPEFQTTVVLYLGISVALASLVFFLAGPFLTPLITPEIPFLPLWPWVLAIACGTVFATLFRYTAQSDQKPVQYIVFTLLHQGVMVAAILYMVVVRDAGTLGQLQGTAFAALLFALVSLVLLRPYRLSRNHRNDLRLSFAYGVPVLPHMLASPVNTLVDRSVVNLLLGSSMTGIYVAGQQLSRISDAAAQALNKAYAPIFNTLAQEAAENGAGSSGHSAKLHVIAEMAYVLTLAILGVGTVVVMACREVLLLLANPEFASAWKIILLLVGAETMRTYYHVFGRSVQFELETIRFMPVLSWSTMLFNLAGNFALIPTFGIVGAAMATFISQCLLAVMTFYLGRRALAVPYPWRRMGLALGGFALTCALLTGCDVTADAWVWRLPLKLAVALPFGLYVAVTLFRRVRDPEFARAPIRVR